MNLNTIGNKRKKIINDLKRKWCLLKKVDDSITETYRQEHYSRRNSVCWFMEYLKGNTNVLALEGFENKIELKITESDIDGLYRIVKQKSSSKPRPIIVKFVR